MSAAEDFDECVQQAPTGGPMPPRPPANHAVALREQRERELRFAAIRDWANYAINDSSLHVIAAQAITELVARIERPSAILEAENVSGPERRSERPLGALASHLTGGG